MNEWLAHLNLIKALRLMVGPTVVGPIGVAYYHQPQGFNQF